MSFWSDLYAGDADRIGRAFADGEAIDDQPFVAAHANLHGIIPSASEELPNSPNLLTEIACSTLRREPIPFFGAIQEHLGGDPDPADALCGAYAMAPPWVALFADLTDAQIYEVAFRWLKECDPGTTSTGERVSAIASMVGEIVTVCRVARDRGVSLVYTWTM